MTPSETLLAGLHGTRDKALQAAHNLGFEVVQSHVDPEIPTVAQGPGFFTATLNLVTAAPAGNGWCTNTFWAWTR